MGMDHISLTCSLSHRLYCPVLSLCHMCVHSVGSGWEWIIFRSPVVCHIDCTVPVLSLCHLCVHSAGSGWEWAISRSLIVCHIDCTVLYCHCGHQLFSLCRQWMGMDHLSLTCSLSHRLYCHVLSLCHQCVFTLRQWMGMDHVSLTCSLSHILYCPVLSLCHLCVHSAGSGWEWTISRSPVVCHIDCTVQCCQYVICVPIRQAVNGNGPSLAHL